MAGVGLRGLVAAAATAALVVLGGCALGTDTDEGTVQPPGSTPASVVGAPEHPVHLVGGELDPAELTVPVGATVTWISHPDEDDNHWIVSDRHDLFDSATIEPGNSYQHTFTEAGTFSYFCLIQSDMHGEIVVEGDPDDISEGAGSRSGAGAA